MTRTDDSNLLVVPRGNPSSALPAWGDRLKGLRTLGLCREWSMTTLAQDLGSRARRSPDVPRLMSAMTTYYGDPTEGDRRAREDAVVLRRAADDPEISLVLADLLFAAPVLGAVATEERPGDVLVVHACNRSLGIRMHDESEGCGTVSIHHLIAAVNALLGETAELRRFVPLVDAPGAQVFVFRTEGQTEALFHLGLLATAPDQLSNYAWWHGSPAAGLERVPHERISHERVRRAG